MVDNNSRIEKTDIETEKGIVTFTQRPITQGEEAIARDESRISEIKMIPGEKNKNELVPEVYIRTKVERLNLFRVLFSLGGEYNGKSHKVGAEGWTLAGEVNFANIEGLHPQVFQELANKTIGLNSFDEGEQKN